MTTLVEFINSSLEGQVTLEVSVRTSLKNLEVFSINDIFFMSLYVKQMAGLEGFEPPSSGFGDRRSSQFELQAYLRYLLPCFPMNRMGFTKTAIFLLFDSIRVGTSIFGSCIISSFATLTGQDH